MTLAASDTPGDPDYVSPADMETWAREAFLEAAEDLADVLGDQRALMLVGQVFDVLHRRRLGLLA